MVSQTKRIGHCLSKKKKSGSLGNQYKNKNHWIIDGGS